MSDRRSFIRSLASLPLIGGSVAILGQPTAAAVPVSDYLLKSYMSWLFMERRMAAYEIAGYDSARALDFEDCRWFDGTPGEAWHYQWCNSGNRGPAGWIDAPQPSSRAAIVLSTVGCSLM